VKPRSNVNTPAQYITSLPADRARTIETVRTLVNKHIPRGYDECLVWGAIGWTIPLSRYPDTYNKQPGFWGLVAIAEVPPLTCILYDTIKHRRLHPAFGWGGAALVASFPAFLLIAATDSCQKFLYWLLNR
jgi:hypothetical protein